MTAAHALETLLVRGVVAGLRASGWRRSLELGAALGDAARALGLRRRTAEANLAHAFPDASAGERRRILRENYRELGRILAEYARLAELARAPEGTVVAAVRGKEHLLRAREAGRGAILLSGHFGNVELLGAFLGQIHPVDFVVRPLRNPGVEAIIAGQRAAAGVGQIRAGAELRRVYDALKAGRWVAMLGDQDARYHGVFVPFMGRLASTAIGPARIALATGAAVIMGFSTRRPDGRHELDVEPPLKVDDSGAPDAPHRLTALATERLEHWVRKRPEAWFWLHRRWKTAPPALAAAGAPGAPGETAASRPEGAPAAAPREVSASEAASASRATPSAIAKS